MVNNAEEGKNKFKGKISRIDQRDDQKKPRWMFTS